MSGRLEPENRANAIGKPCYRDDAANPEQAEPEKAAAKARLIVCRAVVGVVLAISARCHSLRLR